MDTSSLKNIVVLKDLPSNIVEEAIVVLKENQKIQKLELIDKTKKKNKNQVLEKTALEQGKAKDYIVKEAQMLISDYISKIENKNKTENQSIQTLKKKYKKVKTINHVLLAGLIFIAIIQFIV